MITILVVGEPKDAEELDRVAAREPSVELLHARDVEEVLERLSRNRRIDAVLLLLPPEKAREVAAVIGEEDPGAPPLFAPASPDPPPDVRLLPATTPADLLEAIVLQLSG